MKNLLQILWMQCLTRCSENTYPARFMIIIMKDMTGQKMVDLLSTIYAKQGTRRKVSPNKKKEQCKTKAKKAK